MYLANLIHQQQDMQKQDTQTQDTQTQDMQKQDMQTQKIKLHPDLEQKIRKLKYSTCMKELTKSRNDKVHTMCEFIQTLMPYKNITEDMKIIIKNLTEVGDFSALNRELNDINTSINDSGYNMKSIFESIQNGLDTFYSLSLIEQNNHKEKALVYVPRFQSETAFENPQKQYFENLYSSIIDNNRKQGIHSGFSFGYCNVHVVGLIMKSKNEKLELWCRLINTYLFKNDYF